ncbi:MAG: tetratricopeptide repeat protein [Acidimicrobiales bacterium]
MTERAVPPIWEDEGSVHAAADAAARRARVAPGPKERTGRRTSLPPVVRDELATQVPARRTARLEGLLADARSAFERDRYADARRALTAVLETAPGIASAHELLGLTLYRMERWREAAASLERFRELTGSVDQHPVLADCYRALRRWTEADALWRELKEASPSAEIVAEGRIVAAGSLADRGELALAIRLLENANLSPAKVRVHHLRTWYALADLLDRAGETGRARRLFQQVASIDSDFADVGSRLANLGR